MTTPSRIVTPDRCSYDAGDTLPVRLGQKELAK
jgi:hypothetical protein